MKTFPLFVAFCFLSLLRADPLLAQQADQNHMPPEAIHTGGPAAAQAAVEVWLAQVDDGQFDKAWDSASGLFKKTVPREQWTGVARSHRSPLGKVLSRKLTSATFTNTLPAAPNGQYVVVEYLSSFEHKKTARETATAMLDLDGEWRMSGYFVR